MSVLCGKLLWHGQLGISVLYLGFFSLGHNCLRFGGLHLRVGRIFGLRPFASYLSVSQWN